MSMVLVDLSGKRTGHTNNHNGTKPVVCKCSTLWRADQYQLLFFAREPGELIAGAAAMIMKEEDNKNGHTDAACNKGK